MYSTAILDQVPVSREWRAGPSALATPFQRASWEMATRGFLRGS